MDDWPAWALVALGAGLGIFGPLLSNLFTLRERRATATKAMVDAQSAVIKDLAFAYDLMTQRPEIVRWIEWARSMREPPRT